MNQFPLNSRERRCLDRLGRVVYVETKKRERGKGRKERKKKRKERKRRKGERRKGKGEKREDVVLRISNMILTAAPGAR